MRRAVLSEFHRPVCAEQDADRVTDYFVDIGWAWAIRQAGIETYSESARRDHPGLLNYCGIGLAWSGLQVGYHLAENLCRPVRLDPAIANHVLPSTYRADKRADDPKHWRRAGYEPPPQPDAIEKDDIICVVTGAGKEYGDHFALVEAVNGEVIETLEFNATGTRGDGSRGRGVVRTTRARGDVRRVIRLEAHHFEKAF